LCVFFLLILGFGDMQDPPNEIWHMEETSLVATSSQRPLAHHLADHNSIRRAFYGGHFVEQRPSGKRGTPSMVDLASAQ
jgi:hypothetical protein